MVFPSFPCPLGAMLREGICSGHGTSGLPFARSQRRPALFTVWRTEYSPQRDEDVRCSASEGRQGCKLQSKPTNTHTPIRYHGESNLCYNIPTPPHNQTNHQNKLHIITFKSFYLHLIKASDFCPI